MDAGKDTEICWICNIRKANSHEHFYKRSDVNQFFGKVNQDNPILKYDHSTNRLKKLNSSKSKDLTFKNKICDYCNGTLTQEFDQAWEKLSEYFFKSHSRLKSKKWWYANIAFKDNTNQMMQFVHLYFLKIFGCHVKESEYLGIDLLEISHNLLNKYSNPNFLLRFGYNPIVKLSQNEGMKYPLVVYFNKKTKKEFRGLAHTVYSIGPLVIDLLYCRNKFQRLKYMNHCYWSPNFNQLTNKLNYFKNEF
jgi:hypothetical protein